MRHATALVLLLLLTPLSVPAADEGLFLTKVDFRTQPDGSERACFSFSEAFTPNLFALEGDRPRIVVDVADVSGWDRKSTYPVSGKLTRQIRCHFYSDTGKLRLVVDLDPALDFVVEPMIDKQNHILCVRVRSDAGSTPGGPTAPQ